MTLVWWLHTPWSSEGYIFQFQFHIYLSMTENEPVRDKQVVMDFNALHFAVDHSVDGIFQNRLYI